MVRKEAKTDSLEVRGPASDVHSGEQQRDLISSGGEAGDQYPDVFIGSSIYMHAFVLTHGCIHATHHSTYIHTYIHTYMHAHAHRTHDEVGRDRSDGESS